VIAKKREKERERGRERERERERERKTFIEKEMTIKVIPLAFAPINISINATFTTYYQEVQANYVLPCLQN